MLNASLLSSLTVHQHDRLTHLGRSLYPVLSRRAGGLSLGINLNLDKACSFDCVYCQVDRTSKDSNLKPDREQILQEIKIWLEMLQTHNEGRSWPPKDISIAGDGEPTLVPFLPALMEDLVAIKQNPDYDPIKLILFTNGLGLHDAALNHVLPAFYQAGGELWIKLDFWDQESLMRIHRIAIAHDKLLDRILVPAKKFPVVFQSCFFQWDQQSYDPTQTEKYIQVVNFLLSQKAQIRTLQAYTLARVPASAQAKPWDDATMDQIASHLRSALSIPIELYYEKGQE